MMTPLTADIQNNARCTLAEPMSRVRADAVGPGNVNWFPTQCQLSGTRQETLVSLSANIKHV